MATYYIPNSSGWKANGGGTYTTYMRAKLDTSYNPATNKTAVTMVLEVKNENLYLTWQALNGGTLQANGSVIHNFTPSDQAPTRGDAEWRQLTHSNNPLSWSFEVQHADDGSVSIPIELNVRLYRNYGGREYHSYFEHCGGTLRLQEPRASEISASNGTIGSAVPITVTRKSTAYTHTVKATCLGREETIASGSTASSLSWTPALATYAPLMPKTMTTTATITCYTYASGALVGQKSVTITLSLPAAAVKPTLALQVTDAATAPKDVSKSVLQYYGDYIATKSKLHIVTQPGLKYGATVERTSIHANRATYSSSPADTTEIIDSGSQGVQGSITDSRGQTASAVNVINVLAYDAPVINAFAVHRCTEDGTLDDTGGYCRVDYDVAITPLNNRNGKTLTVQIRQVGTTNYTDTDVPMSGYTASGSVVIAADTEHSHDVRLVLTDDFGSSVVATQLSTAYVRPLNFPAGGRGIGIGKVSEINDAVELNPDWSVYHGGNLLGEIVNGRTVIDKEIPSGTGVTNLAEITLPRGVYILIGSVKWQAAATGIRYICIDDGPTYQGQLMQSATMQGYADEDNFMQVYAVVAAPAAGKTYYLNVYQRALRTITASGRIRAVRIM